MKTLIKLFVLTAALLAAGCRSNDSDRYTYESDRKQMQTGFNEENYVWENFLFPTNRTER